MRGRPPGGSLVADWVYRSNFIVGCREGWATGDNGRLWELEKEGLADVGWELLVLVSVLFQFWILPVLTPCNA